MTVKQLKEALEKYPDDMDVFIAERKTLFTYGLLNSVREREIDFYEDEDDESLAKENVVILDEE